jgi:hypothetical protein
MSDSVTKYFENADITRNVSIPKSDKIVHNVVQKYNDRSAVGIEKYNTTLEDSKEDTRAFLIHLQEEMMDGTLYIEKLLKLLDDAN